MNFGDTSLDNESDVLEKQNNNRIKIINKNENLNSR
jgi:hypothetical protein